MGTVYVVREPALRLLRSRGPPRQHSPLEIDQPAAKSAFWCPCKEGPAPTCQPLSPLCLSLSPFHPGWILLEAPSVSETRVPVLLSLLVTFAWLWYQIVGIMKKPLLPACQRRCCDCHPAPCQGPSARARPQRRASLHELRGAFPGTLLSLGPKRGDSFDWGSWF